MVGRVALVNKVVSKKLGKEEKVVTGVMNFFYTELHSTLKECKHPHVFVKDFGTFTMRLRPVEGRIKHLLAFIRKARENKALPEELRNTYINGMRREVFYLLGVRRMIKTNKKEYKSLKYGKSIRETVDDIEG